jgi:autotransporter-associated beta strand protein
LGRRRHARYHRCERDLYRNPHGAGPLTKGSSTNTIILTGDNDYGVGTTISGGALQIGNGGRLGSILGHVVDNGTLIFNRSDAYQVPTHNDGRAGSRSPELDIANLIGNNNYSGPNTHRGRQHAHRRLAGKSGCVGGGVHLHDQQQHWC